MKKPVKAYSYIRFSTPTQREGDSLRRQLRKSERYAHKHGLELDSEIRDLGVSAFKGAHRHKGALKAFLDRIDANEIERGSFLLVENLDRLTREDVLEAVALFLNIINAGITVVTFSDNMTYNREVLIAHPEYLNISIAQFIRGNQESARKAELLLETWDEKRAALRADLRRKLTRQGPAWLDLVPDDPKGDPLIGEWRANERASIVQRIFRWCCDGLGKELIARRLTDEHIPTFKHGDGWQASTVLYLLRDRRVLGEFQPHTKAEGKRRPQGPPIKNYFPEIVSPSLFYDAQRELQGRFTGATPAKKGKVPNLFVGIARCECGRSMEYRDKNSSKSNWRAKSVYLICSGCRRSAQLCDNANRFEYSELEDLVLDWVADITITDDDTVRANILANELAAKQAECADITRRLASALHAYECEMDPTIQAHFMERSRALRLEQENAEAVIATLAMAVAGTKRDVIDDRRSVVMRVRKELSSAHGAQLFDTRARLASAIRKVIDHIEFSTSGEFEVYLHGGLKCYRFRNGAFYAAYEVPDRTQVGVAPGVAFKFPSVEYKRKTGWYERVREQQKQPI